MIRSWVVNASPIILYARIDRLDLIEKLAPAIIVPDKVLEEVAAGKGKDMTAQIGFDWGRKYRVTDIPVATTVEHWDIGSGESQVISHCLKKDFWAIVDDKMARRCAKAHYVPVIGSLGIVLRAKRKGIIGDAGQIVEKLKQSGLYADRTLVKQALSAVGE